MRLLQVIAFRLSKRLLFNFVVIVGLLFLLTFLVVSKYELNQPRNTTAKMYPTTYLDNTDCQKTLSKINSNFWSHVDLLAYNIPEEMKNKAKSLQVADGYFMIDDVFIHYKTIIPSKEERSIPVLLLHGQAYSAETWEQINTLQLLAAFGYHTVAVDLPGYGNSTGSLKRQMREKFLTLAIDALKLNRPVIISPSMSGALSIPYVIEKSNTISGFVPISPVSTKLLEENICQSEKLIEKDMDPSCSELIRFTRRSEFRDLSCLQVPTLVVYGEHSKGMGPARLCYLPWSQGVQVPIGRYAAYLSNPNYLHKVLYNFLNIIDNIESCKNTYILRSKTF